MAFNGTLGSFQQKPSALAACGVWGCVSAPKQRWSLLIRFLACCCSGASYKMMLAAVAWRVQQSGEKLNLHYTAAHAHLHEKSATPTMHRHQHYSVYSYCRHPRAMQLGAARFEVRKTASISGKLENIKLKIEIAHTNADRQRRCCVVAEYFVCCTFDCCQAR